MKEIPSKLNFRMPAEWEKHEATWLSWPKDPTTWPDRVDKAEEVYLQMISALHKNEKVNLLVDNEKTKEYIKKKLHERGVNSNVSINIIKTVDSWIRDYGPTFITNEKESAYVKWIFNAWGNKYLELLDDNNVCERIKQIINLRKFDAEIVLEGGSIDVNGSGSCLTTEQCLLNKNRNPKLLKKDIEQKLTDFLGVKNIIWLEGGIAGDDTDGHVDDIARFVGQKTILCAVEKNKEDENYAPLMKNFERLKNTTDENGSMLEIIPVPMPSPRYADDGRRLAATYLNFYIANNVVLLPLYNDKNDEKAMKILKGAFPEREIIGMDCSDFIYGYGAIHCVTQQQPVL